MLNKRYQEAVQGIERLLNNLSEVRTLSSEEMSLYGERFTRGWDIPGLCEGLSYKLRVLIPSTAPYAPPRIAVWPAPPLLEWPHLEDDGLLCILSDAATHSISDYERVTKSLLSEARRLVNDSVAETNIRDFEDEFQSYWNRWGTERNDHIYIDCLPEGPSRWVSSWHSQAGIRIAETETELLNRMERLYGKEILSKITPQKIPLLWLPRPLRPKEYPKKVRMLQSLLREMGIDAVMLKELFGDETLRYLSFVLGFKGRHGVGFAGLSIGSPPIPLKKGFRHRPPEDVVVMRYGGAKITPAKTMRLDGPWIHGRDHNEKERILSKKVVVIFGIGSLGSFITTLLVMSGVGELILVDPEILSSENVGRHMLGIDSIRNNKAIKLAKDLSARFPHLKICGYNESCETFCITMLPTIQSADLIISTIGAWRSEAWLNAMAVDSTISPPILYGWTEAHAAAGHAVVFYKGNGCLRCIRDDMGQMKIPVTSWPGPTLLPIPACGGFFQPYGAVELSHIHGLIADLALDVLLGNAVTSIHNAWIGFKKIIEITGGTWNTAWIERNGDPGRGGFLIDIKVLHDLNCPECGRPA